MPRLLFLSCAVCILIMVSSCSADPENGVSGYSSDDGESGEGEAGVNEYDGSASALDGGADADAGTDGGSDGIEGDPYSTEACGGCGPEQPYCDAESGKCLACRVGHPYHTCSGAASICLVDDSDPDDVTKNRCVECLIHNDCDGVCDPDSHLCVVCYVKDGQSIGCGTTSGRSSCKTTRDAKRNRCVECVQDDDCTSSSGGPLCDPEDNKCVECLEDAHCTDRELPHCGEALSCVGCEGESHCAHLPETPLCMLDTGVCVECLEHEQCLDPAASRCDAASGFCVTCAVDDDCSHLEGTEICDVDPDDGDNSRCVQCTGDEYDVCSSYKEFVCDSRTRTCSTEFVVAGAEVCDFCVSDAQCIPGTICVRQTYGPDQVEVGYFCQWIEGAQGAPETCSLQGRPFVQTVVDAVSIDGQVATVCALGAATCPALADAEFLLACDPEGDPAEECGHPDLEDGICLQVGVEEFRCSIPCDSVDDCPVGSASCATVNQVQVCEL